uniref:Putative secretory protein n=1 Tax=Argas monolakensis TaxID=34602 RepID=Q09JG7_ARGMO|nr:putative secretory protein [Argas monolakensis]
MTGTDIISALEDFTERVKTKDLDCARKKRRLRQLLGEYRQLKEPVGEQNVAELTRTVVIDRIVGIVKENPSSVIQKYEIESPASHMYPKIFYTGVTLFTSVNFIVCVLNTTVLPSSFSAVEFYSRCTGLLDFVFDLVCLDYLNLLPHSPVLGYHLNLFFPRVFD